MLFWIRPGNKMQSTIIAWKVNVMQKKKELLTNSD